TAYAIGQLMTVKDASGERHYECTTPGTSDLHVAPTATGNDVADGTVVWRSYVGPVTLDWSPNSYYTVGRAVRIVDADGAVRHYECTHPGLSGASAPAGTGSDIVDGEVHWRYYTGGLALLESNGMAQSSPGVPDTNRAILLSMGTPFYVGA